MRKVIVALALLLACGTQVAVGEGAAAEPKTHTVVVAGMKFSPETLAVARGDVVVWVNKDFFPHTATARDRTFDSGEFGAGSSFRYVADKAGTFPYICTLHPTMKATLIVK